MTQEEKQMTNQELDIPEFLDEPLVNLSATKF